MNHATVTVASPVAANHSNAPDTITVDHWRCRFVAEAGEGNTVDKTQIISLLQRFNDAGLDVVKTENLYNFDGDKGYSA